MPPGLRGGCAILFLLGMPGVDPALATRIQSGGTLAAVRPPLPECTGLAVACPLVVRRVSYFEQPGATSAKESSPQRSPRAAGPRSQRLPWVVADGSVILPVNSLVAVSSTATE